MIDVNRQALLAAVLAARRAAEDAMRAARSASKAAEAVEALALNVVWGFRDLGEEWP